MKTLFSVLCSILLLLFVLPQPGNATTLISGSGIWGSFTGLLTYNYSSPEVATLVVELENTSPASNGGYLTAFVLNNPGNNITEVMFSDSYFCLLGGPSFNNSINASPFGSFDIGAGLGGAFEGGGNPQNGIGVVDGTKTFTFVLSGLNLDTLGELDFVNTLSSGASPGQGNQFFVGRFKGFNNGESDKTPSGVIPEPSSLLLLGSGFLGFGLFGWFRRLKS